MEFDFGLEAIIGLEANVELVGDNTAVKHETHLDLDVEQKVELDDAESNLI